MKKWMKRGGMLIIIIVCGGVLQAQNFNEWFRQKRTQRRYLIQQIVALQAYIEVAKKGYDLTREGLDIISAIRDGDWKQFIEYFGSLESVNPTVKKYKRVEDIIKFNQRIVEMYQVIYKPYSSTSNITTEEKRLADIRFDAVLKSCLLNLQEADDLITPVALTMKDDERIKRIDYIYGAMATNYSLAWHLCQKVVEVVGERQFRANEMEVMKKLQL